MNWKSTERWYSGRVESDLTLARWGHFGVPVLMFPTAGGDAEEIERFGIVEAVMPWIEAGRIKLYSIDSLAGRAWVDESVPPQHSSWLQNRFDACIVEEVLPAIVADCGGVPQAPVVAGCSIGAFNAVATLCRHPDRFRLAIAMSGTYDLTRFLHGHFDNDFYFSSPLHWLSKMPEGAVLEQLRQRFVLLALAGGRWEDPGETWRMADMLGARGVPNRVDPWGPEYDHDWPTWRAMLPRYIEEFVAS